MQNLRYVILLITPAYVSVTASPWSWSQLSAKPVSERRSSVLSSTASVDFGKAKQRLTFSDDGRPVSLASYVLPVVVKDHDGGRGDLNKIILDPIYLRASRGNDGDDFRIQIRGIKKLGAKNEYSSLAFCRWSPGKTSARCAVESGDSSYDFVVVSRGSALKDSKFSISVGKVGFAVATYDNRDGAQAIMVQSRTAASVAVPLSFR